MLLVNREEYPFPSNAHFVHLATIKDGLTDLYVYFKDSRTGLTYIEKVVGALSPMGDVEGFLEQISDDPLWYKLVEFIQIHGLDQMLDRSNKNILK